MCFLRCVKCYTPFEISAEALIHGGLCLCTNSFIFFTCPFCSNTESNTESESEDSESGYVGSDDEYREE